MIRHGGARTAIASLILAAICRADGDPWVTAEALCAKGRHGEAARLAVQQRGPDHAGLAAYVEQRRRVSGPSAAETEARRLLEDDPARSHLEAIEELAGRLSDVVLAVRLERRRTNVLWALKRRRDAALSARRAAGLARGVGWLGRASEEFARAGFMASRTSDLVLVLDIGLRREVVENRRGSDRGRAGCFNYLSATYGRLGDYRKALEYAGLAEAIYRKLDDAPRLIRTLRNKAESLRRRGQYGLARATLEEALVLARAPGLRGPLMLQLADLETEFGDPKDALARLDAAGKIIAGLERRRPMYLAQAAGQRGNALRELDRTADAIRAYRDARDRFRELDDAWGECRAEINLGVAQRRSGRFDDAEKTYARSLALARKASDRHAEIDTLHAIGELRVLQGRPDDALAMLGTVLAAGRELGSSEILGRAHRDRARALLLAGRARAAARDGDAAVTHLLTMLQGTTAEGGARARERRRRFFDVDLECALGVGDPARVLRSLERGRAGALLSSLEARSVIRDAAVPPKLRATERAARRDEAAARAAYEAARDARKRKLVRARRKELEAARRNVADAVDAIRRRAVVAADLLYPQPATLNELQATLRPDEALVLYGTGIAVVVTGDAMRLVRLPDAGRLDRTAAAFAHAAAAGSGYPRDAPNDRPAPVRASTIKLRDTLRAALLDPLELPGKVRRILVSPEGELFRIPFAALAPEREFVHVPSGTTYRALRGQDPVRGDGVLALADPDYTGTRLARLPASRAEAEAAGTVRLLGVAATKRKLAASLAGRESWRGLHLACHGVVDAERPLQSALALAGGESLTALELYQWRVPAELVVLSACETGRGRIYAGEGLVGFTRAFLFAGAPRVIVSLWKVDDRATAALMNKFYELWAPDGQRGLTAAAALHAAQAHVRGNPRWQHPYYWAAWTLWGLP